MKAQVWYLEFIVAIVVVTIMTTLFLQYLSSTQSSEESVAVLHTQAVRMSEIVIGPGVPANWTNDTVRLAGITDANWRINNTKVHRLYNLTDAQARLGLTAQTNFYMYIANQTQNITFQGRDYIGTLPSQTIQQAAVNRFVLYNGSIVRLTMVVWK